MSRWSLCATKRVLDVIAALFALSLFALPMLVIALCIRFSSKGPALFVQWRVGRRDRLFRIYKFRTMYVGPGIGPASRLTRDCDDRITRLGRWLRNWKLDELPQFYNVLRGDMSLVGPRPKLPQFAAIAKLPCRPGITGAATLAFRREELMLRRVHPDQVENFYHQRVKPLKARIDIRYMRHATFWSDLQVIVATLLACTLSVDEPRVLRNALPRIVEPLRNRAPKTRASGPFERISSGI